MADLVEQRGAIHINIDEMDGILNERCKAFINADERSPAQEAALYEYIDATLEIINLAGSDPNHRSDVVKQARYIIGYHLRDAMAGMPQYRKGKEERLLEMFDIEFVKAVLDKQYNNSQRETNSNKQKVDDEREKLRASFQKTMSVYIQDREKISSI